MEREKLEGEIFARISKLWGIEQNGTVDSVLFGQKMEYLIRYILLLETRVNNLECENSNLKVGAFGC